ncbi:hypothetical protein Drorol1_Dr00012271 [Drosera rotundifolia]
MCFTDDLMILSKADEASLCLIKTTLDQFHQLSGLRANPLKSQLYFGGIEELKMVELASKVGFQKDNLPIRYLGVPLSTGRMLCQKFEPLVNRIINRIRRVRNS